MNRTTTVLLFALPALSACGQDRTELSLPESDGSPTGSAPEVAAIPAARQVEDRTLTVWVRLKEGAPASPRAEFLAAGARFVSRFHGAMPMAIDIPANHLSSLTARSWLDVVAIDSSGGGRLQGAPRRMVPEALALFPPQSVSWSIQYVGAPVAHARGFTGSGVKIGLLDDGLYCGHSDLYGSVVASYDFAGNQPACVLGSHGTWVAGVLAGRDNSIDVLGVAPSASLYNLRICNLGDCSNGRLYDAIAYAASTGIQVLNYSIADCGGNPPAFPLRQALEAFSAGGGIFVAAGGNGTAGGVTGEACDPGDPVGSIAAANYTIAVAAHLSTGLYHPDYQYGFEIDLSAPTFTQTLSPLGGVTAAGFFGGTSAATPHVAGAAAVLLSAGFPPAKVYQRLKDTAINPVGTGHSYAYGVGANQPWRCCTAEAAGRWNHLVHGRRDHFARPLPLPGNHQRRGSTDRLPVRVHSERSTGFDGPGMGRGRAVLHRPAR